jgi:hypothetical protein
MEALKQADEFEPIYSKWLHILGSYEASRLHEKLWDLFESSAAYMESEQVEKIRRDLIPYAHEFWEDIPLCDESDYMIECLTH